MGDNATFACNNKWFATATYVIYIFPFVWQLHEDVMHYTGRQPIFSLCLKFFSKIVFWQDFFQKYYFMEKIKNMSNVIRVWMVTAAQRVWNNYIEQNMDDSISQNPFVKWPASKMRKIFSLVIHVFSRLSFWTRRPLDSSSSSSFQLVKIMRYSSWNHQRYDKRTGQSSESKGQCTNKLDDPLVLTRYILYVCTYLVETNRKTEQS